jgi:hypothetical protein
MDLEESLRWDRWCSEVEDILSLEPLDFSSEEGIAVEAAGFCERTSEMGSRSGALSLGVFHWRGIARF